MDFILLFCLIAIILFIAIWLYHWLQDSSSARHDDVLYIGDCEGVPGYEEWKRKNKGGCLNTFVFFIVYLLLLLLFF